MLSLLLFLCTQLNSAVTTLVVGNLKAPLTTALGFFLFGKVQLSTLGLGGVALNSVGGVLYSRWPSLWSTLHRRPHRSRNRSGNRCSAVRGRESS